MFEWRNNWSSCQDLVLFLFFGPGKVLSPFSPFLQCIIISSSVAAVTSIFWDLWLEPFCLSLSLSSHHHLTSHESALSSPLFSSPLYLSPLFHPPSYSLRFPYPPSHHHPPPPLSEGSLSVHFFFLSRVFQTKRGAPIDTPNRPERESKRYPKKENNWVFTQMLHV